MATFRASAAGGGTSGSGDRSATITPAVGDLFIVFCIVSGNANDTPTCSDNNGGAYTRIACVPKNVSADRVSAFVRNSLLANTTSTVVTPATGSNTAGSVVVVAVSGMAKVGAAAVRQSASQSNQAGGGTPAPAFSSAALTANMTLGCVGNGTNPAGLTQPTGWTERQDVGQNTPTTGLEVVTRDSGFTGTTITWGSTSASAFGDIIVELNAGNDGTLTITLSDAAMGSDADAAVQGSIASALDAVVLAATAAAQNNATLTALLDAIGFVGTGTVADSDIEGTINVTLDAVTMAASGAVQNNAALAAALDDVAFAGAAAAEIAASLASTLGAVASVVTGDVDVSGGLSVTLDNVTGSPPAPSPDEPRRRFGGGGMSWRERRRERERRLERVVERLEELADEAPLERRKDRRKKFLAGAAGLLLTILVKRGLDD